MHDETMKNEKEKVKNLLPLLEIEPPRSPVLVALPITV
jgi:hypothetical protein